MEDDWVPVKFPENFDQMMEDMANSNEPRIGWCLLCNSPIRTVADLIPGSNVHNCEAGSSFQSEVTAQEQAAEHPPKAEMSQRCRRPRTRSNSRREC